MNGISVSHWGIQLFDDCEDYQNAMYFDGFWQAYERGNTFFRTLGQPEYWFDHVRVAWRDIPEVRET